MGQICCVGGTRLGTRKQPHPVNQRPSVERSDPSRLVDAKRLPSRPPIRAVRLPFPDGPLVARTGSQKCSASAGWRPNAPRDRRFRSCVTGLAGVPRLGAMVAWTVPGVRRVSRRRRSRTAHAASSMPRCSRRHGGPEGTRVQAPTPTALTRDSPPDPAAAGGRAVAGSNPVSPIFDPVGPREAQSGHVGSVFGSRTGTATRRGAESGSTGEDPETRFLRSQVTPRVTAPAVSHPHRRWSTVGRAAWLSPASPRPRTLHRRGGTLRLTQGSTAVHPVRTPSRRAGRGGGHRWRQVVAQMLERQRGAVLALWPDGDSGRPRGAGVQGRHRRACHPARGGAGRGTGGGPCPSAT